MMPVEKLLVHLFPLHRMRIPAAISDEALNDMGGNTMHLKSVGLATLIGLGLIDWTLPAARAGQKPFGLPGFLLHLWIFFLVKRQSYSRRVQSRAYVCLLFTTVQCLEMMAAFVRVRSDIAPRG